MEASPSQSANSQPITEIDQEKYLALITGRERISRLPNHDRLIQLINDDTGQIYELITGRSPRPPIPRGQ